MIKNKIIFLKILFSHVFLMCLCFSKIQARMVGQATKVPTRKPQQAQVLKKAAQASRKPQLVSRPASYHPQEEPRVTSQAQPVEPVIIPAPQPQPILPIEPVMIQHTPEQKLQWVLQQPFPWNDEVLEYIKKEGLNQYPVIQSHLQKQQQLSAMESQLKRTAAFKARSAQQKPTGIKGLFSDIVDRVTIAWYTGTLTKQKAIEVLKNDFRKQLTDMGMYPTYESKLEAIRNGDLVIGSDQIDSPIVNEALDLLAQEIELKRNADFSQNAERGSFEMALDTEIKKIKDTYEQYAKDDPYKYLDILVSSNPNLFQFLAYVSEYLRAKNRVNKLIAEEMQQEPSIQKLEQPTIPQTSVSEESVEGASVKSMQGDPLLW